MSRDRTKIMSLTHFDIFKNVEKYFAWRIEWEVVTGKILLNGETEEQRKRGREKLELARDLERQLMTFKKE